MRIFRLLSTVTCTLIVILTMPASGISQSSVTFLLRDNTAAEHRVGNILSTSGLALQPVRVLLKPDTLFRLSTSGDLFTKDDLDRDAVCGQLDCCNSETCRISMTAYLIDKTALNAPAITIVVEVADENDSAPQFLTKARRFDEKTRQNLSVWELQIPESAPVGSQHALPSATDADSLRFGVRGYTLYPTDYSDRQGNPLLSPFRLSGDVHTSGVSLTQPPVLQVDQPLDREVKASYELTLIAQDAGPTPHQAILRILVRIVDINDNLPVFITPDSQLIRIPENRSVGSVIHRFAAEDPDDGENGNVTLSIDWPASTQGLTPAVVQQLSRKYALTPSTGELRITRSLDYEQEYERRLVLVVKATDHGSPPLTASASVTISLLDVNDNPPVIQVEQADAAGSQGEVGSQGHLVENQPNQKLLRLISVSDPDSVSTGKLSCHLTGSVQDAQFKLQSFSPTMYGLFNVRALDFEKEASPSGHVSVSVECIDQAEPQMRSQEWIQVPLVDVNDNWPQFNNANYQFYVSEDVLVGTEVGRVLATDMDSGAGGKITYTLTADEDHLYTYLTIDSTNGVLRTGSPFDRENLQRMDFHITARDGGDGDVQENQANGRSESSVKTNTTSVTIFILDVNDNDPIYLGPTEIHMSEMAPVGTEILSEINFNDADLGSNGTVTVSLFDQFYERVSNGQKYDFKNPLLNEGQPGLVSIIAGSRLVTLTPLDREIAPRLIVTLIAKDNGKPRSLSTTTSLTVIVDDVNDNAPELTYPRNATMLIGLTGRSNWMDENTASTIPADTPADTLLATIRGNDLDAGENATVTYHIVQGPPSSKVSSLDTMGSDSVSELAYPSLPDGYGYFKVNPNTGHLSTAWGGSLNEPSAKLEPRNASVHFALSLDPVQHSVEPPIPGIYVLYMELRDCGIPQQRTRVIFYVNISDALGTASAFVFFNQLNLSNTVIFALLGVCSITLIISLTAAIFWVRYRGDRRRPNGHYTSSYCGASMVPHDLPHNGYFYSAPYPTIAGIGNLNDLGNGYPPSPEAQSMEGFGLTHNSLKTKINDMDLPAYFSSGGLPGTQTLVPHSVTGQITQSNQQFSTIAYPLQCGIFPPSTAGDPGSEVAFLPMTSNPHEWQYHTAYDPGLVISPSTITVNQRPVYGLPCQEVFMPHNEYGTNRSNGGSDSGVDSGGAVMNGSLAPTTNSSPSRDAQRTGNTFSSSTHVNVNSFCYNNNNNKTRISGKYSQGVCEVKSFGTADPVFEVDCSGSCLSGPANMVAASSAGVSSPTFQRNYPTSRAGYVASSETPR